jgi:hypothetical protein
VVVVVMELHPTTMAALPVTTMAVEVAEKASCKPEILTSFLIWCDLCIEVLFKR